MNVWNERNQSHKNQIPINLSSGLRMSDPLPPKGHHYGLSLLTAIVTGLLLPRFAIAMDTGKFIYWDNIAKLSSDIKTGKFEVTIEPF